MGSVMNGVRAVWNRRGIKWGALGTVAAALVAGLIGATAQTALPPVVDLATEPLYALGARAKPTLTLDLSVEFPTVGAQFRDVTYLPTSEYVGYFDAESCYRYNNAPTDAPADANGVRNTAGYKRFDRIGDANRNSTGTSLRTCDGIADGTARGGFSGNFMNWAASSSIDILRRGLSGGDRIVDDPGLTVLQRAVLQTNFYNNSSNFPGKVLAAAQVAGAVPEALLTTTTGTKWAGNVYVANCLNRIFFGTASGGSCSTPSANGDLGIAAVASITDTPSYVGSLPAGAIVNGPEGNNVAIPPGTTQQIFYGDIRYQTFAVKTYVAGSTALNVACTNSTFGDPLPNVVKTCYSLTIVGLTSDAFFYTRVKVCESDITGLIDPRKDMCLQYPNGYYKPVGNLQKYSDRLRVAAFGYLNDNAGNPNERYGGVLRAAMKYVGPKQYDANFALLPANNPYQEWKSDTGQLIADPNSQDPSNPSTEGRSGVINYLNQFGRTGPTQGVYKTYDPVGELYYESLRYLQGLQPTPEALPAAGTSATTLANWKDGFPIYTTWTDPHPPSSNSTDYACVRNNIVTIGDVNTHNDKYIPGNTRTNNDKVRTANEAANEPNFSTWTHVVGGFESGVGVSYTDGKGRPQTTSNPNTPNAALTNLETINTGADGAAYYIAGVAYWANTHDIRGTQWTDTTTNPGVGDPALNKQRPGMRVTTYMLDVNENGSDSNATNRRKTQFFLTAKYGGFADGSGTGSPFAPGGSSTTNVNESWEAPPAGSGEANNYFLSSSAKNVLAALDKIFASIAQQANSIAGAAASTGEITTTEGYIYRSQFDASDWSGDLTATPVSAAASGGAVAIGSKTSTAWTSAATVLGTQLSTALGLSARKVYVGGATSADTATEFVWSNSLASYVKQALQTPLGSTLPTDSEDVAHLRLDYLRGDRAMENSGVFRKRSKLVGDIINSGVVYSGAPSTLTSASSYGSFYADNLNRSKALFVGANDGMLHAFDAGSGKELFAYIPSFVVPRLSALTSNAYVHQSYVDAPPVVADAKVGSNWKTVLVAGAGGGGQGVFALDVTNPDPLSAASSRFGADKVLWEFTDADDSDLGNVVGRPQVLAFRTGTSTAVKYFAVVASGVNNYAADRYSRTVDGASSIFLLDLNKGSARWALNINYFKITLPQSSTAIANGLINFSARVESTTGAVTAIYAGDLQGNVWKLDFTRAAATSDWTMATLSPFGIGTGATRVAKPFYIATDGAANNPSRQPITMSPSLIFGPNGTVVVAFGTGKFLEVRDTAASAKQSVYAVMDDGSATLDVASTVAVAGRGRLQSGTLNSGVITVPPFVYGRPTSDNQAATPSGAPPTRAGWYFDFATAGERQVSGFVLGDTNAGSSLVFNSVIPSLNSCNSGTGNLYVVDVLTGAGTSAVSDVGISGEPLLFNVADSSLSTSGSDSTGQRVRQYRWQIVNPGSAGNSSSTPTQVDALAGRLSWRELANRP